MTHSEALDYVKAAARVMVLPLNEARAQRVAAQLASTALLARQLDEFALDVGDEAAEIYCPAPFPPPADGRYPA